MGHEGDKSVDILWDYFWQAVHGETRGLLLGFLVRTSIEHRKMAFPELLHLSVPCRVSCVLGLAIFNWQTHRLSSCAMEEFVM
jgi:hypothetical protein